MSFKFYSIVHQQVINIIMNKLTNSKIKRIFTEN